MWTLDLIIAAVVAVVATGRLTRLVVDDDWPPVAWARGKYIQKAPVAWAELVTCGFCVAPWFALINGAFAWLSYNGDASLDWWWWAPNLWLAAAYAAAILNARDVPSS